MQNYGGRSRMARIVLQKMQNDENLSRIDRNQVDFFQLQTILFHIIYNYVFHFSGI